MSFEYHQWSFTALQCAGLLWPGLKTANHPKLRDWLYQTGTPFHNLLQKYPLLVKKVSQPEKLLPRIQIFKQIIWHLHASHKTKRIICCNLRICGDKNIFENSTLTHGGTTLYRGSCLHSICTREAPASTHWDPFERLHSSGGISFLHSTNEDNDHSATVRTLVFPHSRQDNKMMTSHYGILTQRNLKMKLLREH